MQYSNNILEKYESRPRKWWLYTLIVFIMALLLSWSASSVTFKGFAAKGTEVAKGIFWGLVKPDMNLLFSTSTDGSSSSGTYTVSTPSFTSASVSCPAR